MPASFRSSRGPKLLVLPLGFLLSFLFYPNLSGAALLWNPPRSTPGDFWADLVLGQTDQAPDGSGVSIANSGFGEVKPNQATSLSLFNQGGVFVDRVNNRLYVWDGGNSRVLGFSNIGVFQPNQTTYAPPAWVADMVLGQPDFSHASCNGDGNYQNYPTLTPPNASELCGMAQQQLSIWEGGTNSNMAVDSQGDLYVPDSGNNRVLRYEFTSLPSGVMGPAASHVWGQPDFASYQANLGYIVPNNTSLYLNNNGGAAIDSQGNLWVADSGNNRVLRFPNQGGVGGVPNATADLVLGQSNFNTYVTASGESDLTHLSFPVAVRVDSNGNVFVSDMTTNSYGGSGRILIYKPSTYLPGGVPTSGVAADGKITQGVSYPQSIDLLTDKNNSALDDLWVDSFTYDEIVMYTVDFSGSAPTGTPQKVLLQHQLSTTLGNVTNASAGDGPNNQYNSSYSNEFFFDYGPVGVAVDNNENVYVGFKASDHDVYRFPGPIPPLTGPGSLSPGVAHSADVDIFKRSEPAMKNQKGPNNLEEGVGVAVAQLAPTPQIIVSDDYRLMYWNIPSGGPQGLTNGRAPSGYAGTTASLVNNSGVTQFFRIAVDQASPTQHLWVSTTQNNLVGVQVYNLPLLGFDNPVDYLNPTIPVLGGGTVTIGAFLDDIAPDPTGTYLWIADRANQRVFRVRNPLTAPMVDILLGQTSATGNLCNMGAANPSSASLCSPGAVALDHHGDLFVSDASLETAGNGRMLRWDVSQLPTTQLSCLFAIPATAVYADGGNFNTAGCIPPSNYALNECGPFKPAFNRDDSVMVAGQNGYTGNRFPVVLQNPRAGDTPVAILKDWSSMSYTSAFDNQDNLYVTDLDRARMLVYLAPFPSPTPTATGTLTPTFSPTPTADCCQVAQTIAGQGGGGGAFNTTACVAVAGVTLVAADFFNNRVQEFQVPGGGPAGTIVGFNEPYAVAGGPGGNSLFVGDYGDYIVYQVTLPGGAPVSIFTAAGPVRGLSVDANGDIYVVSEGTAAVQIYQFISPGVYTAQTPVTLGISTSPRGVLKVGPKLYVVDAGNNYVLAFTQGAGYNFAGPQEVVPGTLLNYPSQLSIDKLGYFYLANGIARQILVFNPDFSLNHTCNLTQGPGGVAVDAGGYVYAAVNGTTQYVFQFAPCPLVVSLSPTNTPTPSPTITPSQTPTKTPSNSPTNTPTRTPTMTGTNTPTNSPTNTPTNSPSLTPTNSPTMSPTNSPTSSPTPSPTLTITLTPTVTLTPTISPTPTITPTPVCPDGIYPDPIRSEDPARLQITLRDPGDVHIQVWTLACRKIVEWTFTSLPAGVNDLPLVARDKGGVPIANGLYYLVETADKKRTILKLLILR